MATAETPGTPKNGGGRTLTRRRDPRAAFLRAYKRVGTVRHACQVARIGRATFYRWRDADPDFAAAVAACEDDVTDRLEERAHERALAQSDTLLIFLLKSRRPERYNPVQTRKLEVDGGLTLTAIGPDAIRNLTDAELAQARRLIRKMRGEKVGSLPASDHRPIGQVGPVVAQLDAGDDVTG